jgi:hypothetical protein
MLSPYRDEPTMPAMTDRLHSHLKPMEIEFLRRLQDIDEFEHAGFRGQPLPAGGIAITRGDQIRGVWSEDAWVMSWQPTAAETPERHVGRIDDALRVTLHLVLMSLRVRRSKQQMLAA